MDRLLRIAQVVSREAACAGGALIMIGALAVSVDVILRKLFTVSLGGADEIAGYALAIGSAWAFAFALLERAHIRIDSLYVKLAPRVQAALDLAGVAALGAFMALVTWHGTGVLAQSLRTGARSMSALETPVAVPQALWLGGLALFMAVAVLLLLRALAALARGDLATLAGMIGSRSAIEETEEELRAVAAARAGDGEKR
ncbi:MAG: TRAP transporter small permease [Alphaproteobacteria bacterium]|nr:TRAP transporter small permease [Alphaproteobacteria bacterium]